MEQGDPSIVSILARPFERALPTRASWLLQAKTRFQSSPALSSGRYSTSAVTTADAQMFQSSPALSSGRYNRRIMAMRERGMFQSSPALSSGRYEVRAHYRPA